MQLPESQLESFVGRYWNPGSEHAVVLQRRGSQLYSVLGDERTELKFDSADSDEDRSENNFNAGAVYGISVFTHLGRTADFWLGELQRLLSPEGRAFVTYHDETLYSRLRASGQVPARNPAAFVSAMRRLGAQNLAEAEPSLTSTISGTDLSAARVASGSRLSGMVPSMQR